MSDNTHTPFDDYAEEAPQRPTRALPPQVSSPRARGGKLPVPTADLTDYGDLADDDNAALPPQSTPAPRNAATGALPNRMPPSVLVGVSVVAGALLVVVVSLLMNALIAKPPVNSDGLVGDEQPRVAVVPGSDEDNLEEIPREETPLENAAPETAPPPAPVAPPKTDDAPVAAPDAPAVAGEVFRHSEKGYRITPPAGFTLQKEGRRTIWKGPDDAQLLVETTPTTQSSPRESWEQLDKNLSRKYGSRYRNLGISETTLAGHPAAVWEFEIENNDGTTTRKMDVGVHYRGAGYAVLAAAPAARFEELRPQLESAVNSLQLPDKPVFDKPARRPSKSTPPRRSTPDKASPPGETSDGEVVDGY